MRSIYPVSTDGGDTWYIQICKFLTRSSSTFLFKEKLDRKDDAIYKIELKVLMIIFHAKEINVN